MASLVGSPQAHPRLGQAQSFRGPAEVQFLSQSQEDLDLGGVHGPSGLRPPGHVATCPIAWRLRR
jgi:hypothetical protein